MPGDHIWLGRVLPLPLGPPASHVCSFCGDGGRGPDLSGSMESFPLPASLSDTPASPPRPEGGGKWEREAFSPRLLPALALSPGLAWSLPGEAPEPAEWTELGGELVLGTQLWEAPGKPPG